jgi:hypothetical protein
MFLIKSVMVVFLMFVALKVLVYGSLLFMAFN